MYLSYLQKLINKALMKRSYDFLLFLFVTALLSFSIALKFAFDKALLIIKAIYWTMKPRSPVTMLAILWYEILERFIEKGLFWLNCRNYPTVWPYITENIGKDSVCAFRLTLVLNLSSYWINWFLQKLLF